MFIMELPPYRMPTAKSLMIHTWEKGKHYLIKAGTWILAISVFVWFCLNLPWGVESKKDSYLGKTGQIIARGFPATGIRDLGSGHFAFNWCRCQGNRHFNDG